MPPAVLEFDLKLLSQFLKLEEGTDILKILPPGLYDFTNRTCHVVIDSPSIPYVPQGHPLPICRPDYTMKNGVPVFNGYSFIDEQQELPESINGMVFLPEPNPRPQKRMPPPPPDLTSEGDDDMEPFTP